MNESYWQRGFEDGLAQRPASPPNRDGQWDRQNEGYSNGYEAGRSKRWAADWPERRERMLRLLDGGAVEAQPETRSQIN
jgi:hypothetical protein